MNDLVQQIKGIKKRRRERDFLGSLPHHPGTAGRDLKGVGVLAGRVLGIPIGGFGGQAGWAD